MHYGKSMRKYIFLATVIIFILTSNLFAYTRQRGDYFLRPQIGIWYGVVTPVYTTWNEVDTNLGGGAFFRYNTLWSPLKIGVEVSYQNHKSDGINELMLVPTYGNLIYKIPFNFPVNVQLKAGAGVCYARMKPMGISQRDPLFVTGLEFSFPAGKTINIGLRVDYLLLYEKHLEDAEYNGHFVNCGLSVYFNI